MDFPPSATISHPAAFPTPPQSCTTTERMPCNASDVSVTAAMASETQLATGPRHRQNVTDVFLVDFGYGEITSDVFLRQLMIFDDKKWNYT